MSTAAVRGEVVYHPRERLGFLQKREMTTLLELHEPRREQSPATLQLVSGLDHPIGRHVADQRRHPDMRERSREVIVLEPGGDRAIHRPAETHGREEAVALRIGNSVVKVERKREPEPLA